MKLIVTILKDWIYRYNKNYYRYIRAYKLEGNYERGCLKIEISLFCIVEMIKIYLISHKKECLIKLKSSF
ncbi:hypothetical protein BN168_410010 [Clostridioides difficile CD002]|nr:hypothetical protein BN168_410010 [Clostridioides difficile CD002]